MIVQAQRALSAPDFVGGTMARRRIIPIFVPHLGCPHQCVFCNQRCISGCECAISPDDVEKRILDALPKSGNGAEVAFYGGSFTAIEATYQEALLAAVQPFLARGDISEIRVSTRPDAIDDAVIARLHNYGVRTVELGCQSLSDEVLLASKRGHTRADILNAVSNIKRSGFRVIMQMMTGLPADTDIQAMNSAHEIVRCKPDGVRIYPTVVIRGTELYERFLDGSYKEHTVEAATALCAKIFEIFVDAHIPVLRIGLQESEGLHNTVAGAYHPALGELVKSRYYRNLAAAALSARPYAESAEIGVSANRISMMVGQKRCNIDWLEEHFSMKRIKVIASEVEDWEITLKSGAEIDRIKR